MLRELRAHFEKWRILGYFLAKFPLEKPKITILTYNCAHLKSTKESLTILVKIFGVKIFLSENFLGEFFLGNSFFGWKFFW